MKTLTINHKEVERSWKLIDADGKVLGRVASEAAKLLRGKHKPFFSPNVDCGDYVVIINAEKAILTGKKAEQKEYFKASTRVGKSKMTSYEDAMANDSTFPLIHAIKGMLPKTILGSNLTTKLHVYAGPEHKHGAQNPELIEL